MKIYADNAATTAVSDTALAAMLPKLYADPEQRRMLGQAAAERSLLFDEKTIHARMKEIYFGEGR